MHCLHSFWVVAKFVIFGWNKMILRLANTFCCMFASIRNESEINYRPPWTFCLARPRTWCMILSTFSQPINTNTTVKYGSVITQTVVIINIIIMQLIFSTLHILILWEYQIWVYIYSVNIVWSTNFVHIIWVNII